MYFELISPKCYIVNIFFNFLLITNAVSGLDKQFIYFSSMYVVKVLD